MNIISSKPGKIIVSQPPCRRSIDFTRNMSDYSLHCENSSRRYFLSFPQVFFGFYYHQIKSPFFQGDKCQGDKCQGDKCQFDSLHCTFSSNDILYYTSLPNVGLNGYTCLGEDYDQYFSSTEIMIDTIIANFWQTLFSTDIRQSIDIYKNHVLGNFEKWQEKTKANPEWIPSAEDLIEIEGTHLVHWDF